MGRVRPARGRRASLAPSVHKLSEARSRSSPGVEPTFAVVRLRLDLQRRSPLAALSLRHPEMVVLVNHVQTTGRGSDLVECDLFDVAQDDHAPELRRMAGVVSVHAISSSGYRTRYRIESKTPPHLRLLTEFNALLRYPAVLYGGACTMDLEAPVDALRELIRRLHRSASGVTVLRWGPDLLPSVPLGLTGHQQSLLRQAVSAGYFEVPRLVTLTAFASRLDRSKSSVSRALSLIEKRLAEASVLTHA